MSAEQITQDPTLFIRVTCKWMLCTIKSWSDPPMHRLGNMRVIQQDKSSTDAFLILFLIPVMLIIIVYKAFWDSGYKVYCTSFEYY